MSGPDQVFLGINTGPGRGAGNRAVFVGCLQEGFDEILKLALSSCVRVVVVGAGPGGGAAAITLAHGGAEVIVIDKATFPA